MTSTLGSAAGVVVLAACAPLGTTQAGEPVDVSAPTVVDALQGRDGVRIQTLCTHCNSANIQVGGLSNGLVPVFRDGFPLVGGLQRSFVMSFLPADAIARAEIVKGPGAADQSNVSAGGEIALRGASARELPRLDLMAETGTWNLTRGTARLAGELSSWAEGSFTLGTTNSDRIDDDRDGWTDVPAVERSFADAVLEFRPAVAHELHIGISWVDEENTDGRGAFDAFRYITEGLDSWTREDTDFDRRELRAGWRWRPSTGGTIELRLLGAERGQTVRSQLTALDEGLADGADRLIPRFEISEDNRWARASWERPFGLSWRLAAGGESQRRRVDAINREPLEVLAGGLGDPEFARESVDVDSLWVDAGWNPSPRIDVQVGLRWDAATLTTELSDPVPASIRRTEANISPRATLRYFPASDWTLRLVAGRTFRPPSPMLSQVCCGQRYQTMEHVVSERATTVGFETEWIPNPRLRANLWIARTGFEDYITRVVGWSQVFIQTWALTNVPQASADRVEASLRYRPHPRLTLDGSIGWLAFENGRDEKVDVIVSPPSRTSTETVPIALPRMPYLAERSSSLSANWALAGGVRAGVLASYTGVQSIQQFIRLPLNSRLDTETLRETPGFWLVGLQAEVPVNDALSLLAAVENLTDRLQDDLGDPTTDYNWGPLAGRSWRIGIRARLGRGGARP